MGNNKEIKIAFVDQLGAAGGIIRFGTNLAKSIVELNENIKITYFTNHSNYVSNKEIFENLKDSFATTVLKATKHDLLNKYLRIFEAKLFKKKSHLKSEIYNLTKGFDIVFFTAPHNSEYIKVLPKSFGTFHDFNFMYLFGTPLFKKEAVATVTEEMKQWFHNTKIIVSTPFIKNEIQKFFPNHIADIQVIYLASLANKIEKTNTERFLNDLEIKRPYILYPAHLMPHKNHNNLISAFSKLISLPQFSHYQLVLTGAGTDHFSYAKVSNLGMMFADKTDFHVRGLGYVSNTQVDSLISHATIIISPSLYEAGSGPALDAWINQVPCIISNIPAHLDQINFFNIDCFTFDPMDPNNIFHSLKYGLENINLLKQQSIDASKKLADYGWKQVAQQYLNFFINQ